MWKHKKICCSFYSLVLMTAVVWIRTDWYIVYEKREKKKHGFVELQLLLVNCQHPCHVTIDVFAYIYIFCLFVCLRAEHMIGIERRRRNVGILSKTRMAVLGRAHIINNCTHIFFLFFIFFALPFLFVPFHSFHPSLSIQHSLSIQYPGAVLLLICRTEPFLVFGVCCSDER